MEGAGFIATVIAFIVSLVICLVWRSQMKTANIARTADDFIPPGGFVLTTKEDTFLYKTTTRKKIEKQKT